MPACFWDLTGFSRTTLQYQVNEYFFYIVFFGVALFCVGHRRISSYALHFFAVSGCAPVDFWFVRLSLGVTELSCVFVFSINDEDGQEEEKKCH